ncbi:MAG: iron-containing alcohol dehydrogenase [Devosia nanyangense]|uniref:Iron-containing alcohol dehydrogenase n=1 Tax=Devosia nanyangense TaxID=1228055 RepID=A0A933L190_9HYPH|nr:iron-containing alcohol dehydrogenase [Devosia nanyangense]
MVGSDKIAALLAGTYRDPDSGGQVGVDTKSLVIAPSLDGQEDELLRSLSLGRTLAVISDKTTHAVLGQRIERAARGGARVQSIVLDNGVHPDGESVAAVRQATASADALIAVGSGTINDICKYASAQDGKPYAVFATAPSMNGYTSYNAAITMHGHKLSLPAQVPRGAFFDLSILAAAPVRLIRAGLGDNLCRTTAEADWLLAHELFGQTFRELPYDLLADDETPLFDHAAELIAGDLGVMERLVRTLVLAGFGTAIVGNSQPASQGEHLISHYIDMFAPAERPLVFHGEQVGVTTLSMVRLQERMLAERPTVRPDTSTEAEFRSRYGDELGASCWAEFEQKRMTAERAERLNDLFAADWAAIRDRVRAVLLTTSRLTAVLGAAGSDVTPEAIHLPRAFYETALFRCREIRNRYTFLDLAANAGRLETWIGAL